MLSVLKQAVIVLVLLAPISKGVADESQRGEYLFHISGCALCHTEKGGQALAGGRAIETEFGTLYSPNITPDVQYGIGRWSDADFLRALKTGIAPDGRYYFPAFPYTSYARMTRRDALAIKAYLFLQPTKANENKPHDLPWYLSFNMIMGVWRYFNFDSGLSSNNITASKNRGAYIAAALAHCAECHTPRNYLGGLRSDMEYAGTMSGPDGKSVPNITADKKTGIGRWSKSELKAYLRRGEKPDGDFAGGIMAEVIDNGLNRLTDQDLESLVNYVMTIPPVVNPVSPRMKRTGEFE